MRWTRRIALHRLVIGAAAFGLLACAAKPSTTARDAATPRSQTMKKQITFHPDRVYEVTGIWVKPDQMPALQAYFGEVFPIAAKDYGVKPLFSLEPVNVYAGDFEPQIMFVNEWPSLEAFKGFVNDPRAKALFPRRDAAVSRLVVSH